METKIINTTNSSSDQAFQTQQRLVRVTARALGRAQLAHAYGHCSVRLNAQQFLVCAPRPMGLIRPGETGTVVTIDAPLPDGVLGEVRVHQQIYRRRNDVNGICRSMPKALMALSVLGRTPRPLHGFSSYFWPHIPLWRDSRLIRDEQRAEAVAQQLAQHKAIALRGNGLVTAGSSIQHALVWTWYLENAADLELRILSQSDQALLFDEQECIARATEQGGIIERMWDYLTAGDSEV